MTDVGGELQHCSPDELKALFLFESLTDEQLAYLCRTGHVEVLGPGPLITEGEPVAPLHVLIDGELVISKRSAGRDLEISRTAEPGVYFGARSAFSPVGHDRNRFSVRATRRSRFFVMATEAFGAFVKSEFPMAVHLIDGLASTAEKQYRVADERDRLLALGQLSAALTHELNNPVAAVMRAATELRTQLDALTTPLVDNRFDSAELSLLAGAQADVVARAAAASGRAMSAMHITDLEDEVGEWLSAQGVADAWDMAPAFVEAGLDRQWLEQLSARAWPGDRADALRWLWRRVETELLTHQIHAAAQRISGLVADVKQYTQLNSAPYQFADVNALLTSTLRMFAGRIGAGTEIEVITDLDELLPGLLCYPAELNQVWTNIIDNAIAAMRPVPGGPASSAGTLTVRTRLEDDAVRIEISDTGCGIPDDICGRIFDPFFTTKPLGEGTGLGLHLAWRIVVNRHAGELLATSQPRDTRFVVRLPLKPGTDVGGQMQTADGGDV